jgi:hypothetical protein
MADRYLSELVCKGCGRTAHITWEGRGTERRVVEVSDSITLHLANPPTFTCADCGTTQTPI